MRRMVPQAVWRALSRPDAIAARMAPSVTPEARAAPVTEYHGILRISRVFS